MEKLNLALECFKIAAQVSSPSVSNRAVDIATTGKHLYSEIIALVETQDTLEEKPRRGRPPKAPE